MLRNQRRKHCYPRDALLDVSGSPHTITKEITDHEHQGMVLQPAWVHLETCRNAQVLLLGYILTAHANQSLPGFAETLDHMRAHLPDHCTCSPTEPEEAGGRPRRPDISIRYQQHETIADHRNIPQF